MAVIGAFIGVGAVIIGIANSDPYSDYHDYSNYGNYSNYSDAAVRRQRRIEAKQSEINNQTYEINTYKTSKVNEYLQSESLKQKSGVEVSIYEVKRDGDNKIETHIKSIIDQETAEIDVQISELKKAIEKIDKILEENNENGND